MEFEDYMENRIDSPKIIKDKEGNIQKLSVRFGPHFIFELIKGKKGLRFSLVATHHGFAADASKVAGELEQVLYKIRTIFPEKQID